MPTDKNEKPTGADELRSMASLVRAFATEMEAAADSLGKEKILLATNTFHLSTLERLRAFAARVTGKVSKVNMQKVASSYSEAKKRVSKKKPTP